MMEPLSIGRYSHTPRTTRDFGATGRFGESWTQRFKQRMGTARQRRIDLEVEAGVQAGKIVRLPGKTT